MNVRFSAFLSLLIVCSLLVAQTPAGISGTDFVFWLQADAGVTDDGSGPPPLLTAWADQSGNGLNAGPSGTSPEFISTFPGLNNAPVIDFSNGNSNLLIGNSTLINDGDQSAKTMIVVFQSPSTVVNGDELIYEQGGGTNGLVFYISGDGATMTLNMGVYVASGVYYSFESAPIVSSTSYIATFHFENSTLEGYLNNDRSVLTPSENIGGTPASQDPAFNLLSHTGDIRIGNNTGDNRGVGGSTVSTGSAFSGQIAELIQYNRVLTPAELDAVSSYLGSKYGIALVPEIAVEGNGTDIADGETTYGLGDDREYPTLEVNTESQVNTFTINNTGTAELTISSIVLSNTTDFSIISAPSVVSSGTSEDLTIEFDPASVGILSSTVTISNNDGDEAVFDFTIQGEGGALPEIEITGNAQVITDGDNTPDVSDDTYFGNSFVDPIDRIFTINNDAGVSSALSITTPISISGSGSFSVLSQPASSVAIGGSTTFTIRYTPSGTSPAEVATISIISDDLDENPYTFDVEASSVPTPGGIADNLRFWFKADAGAESDGSGTAASNGSQVQIWQDQSLSNFDGDQTNYAAGRPTYLDNSLNGNPALVFDGTDDFLPISSLVYPDNGSPSSLTVYSVLSTTNSNEGVILSYDRNEYFRFASNHNTDPGFGFSTTLNSSSNTDDFNGTGGIESDGVPHILGGSFNSATVGTNKFLYFDGTVDNSTNAGTGSFGSGVTRYGFIGVGSEDDTGSPITSSTDARLGPQNFLEGSLGEMLYFENELTNVDRQRVETYLAIKYGITLSEDSDGDAVSLETGEGINEGDYVTSSGVAVWDASANSLYQFDIAGVGRDDRSGLLQTTSSSVNSDAIFSLTETTFSADEDFIIWGNNNATVASTASANASADRELDRVWKIQTNAANVSNIDQMTFDVSAISVLPENATDFVLLTDTDTDFSDAGTVVASAFDGSTVTFSGINLTGVSFFTLGYTLEDPAGVSADLAFWFKADDGVEEAAGDAAEDGDQVRFWRDQSGAGYDGNQNTGGNRPRFDATNTINFNPVITFDGATHLSISDLNYNITTNTLDDFTIFSVVKSSQADEGIVVSYDRSSFYRLAINHLGTANFGLSTTKEGATTQIHDNNANTSASDGFAHLIGGDYSTADDIKNLYLDGATDLTINGAHGETGGILGLSTEVPRYGFIAANSEADDPTDGGSGTGLVGDIAEIIYFEGKLNATDRAKIQSYLGIKYAITLGSDYVASDGSTVVWDNSANIGYNELIAGVALDQTGSLSQGQSRSESDGSVLTASASLSDGDYIIWGADNGDLSILTGTVGTKNGRFNRLWKYQITGSTTTVDQILIDISTIVIKPDALANYSLIIDDSDDLATVVREVSPASFTNGVLQFSSVDLSGASFLTLAVTEDLDNDGVADLDDLDQDNDGIPNANEGNGVVDTDGDGIADSRDLDSDNDGIGDLYESGAETETDGIALATLDANGDGIIDVGNEGTNGFDDRLEVGNVDGGGIDYTVSNYETVIDAGGIAGPEDFRDVDTDNNGISDLVESGRSTAIDTDDDGVFEGVDSDLDGVPDEVDAQDNSFGSTLLIPNDQDGTGQPDFRDIDNDDDGTNDVDEVQLTDADMDGMLDGTTDADNDGVLAERDNDEGVFAQIDLASLASGAGTDWYSYRTGDWNDPDNWTTDPSGSTRVNPSAAVPNNLIDNVTILNGDEMTLGFDGLVISSLTVEEGGVLNIGTTINHNFNSISGAGSISLASDEFPAGTVTDFVSSSGGTIIYTDQDTPADYELTVDRTWNNIIFRSAANTITLKSNMTLNGDLVVESGSLQFNDDTSDGYVDNTTPLDVLVNGNFTVNSGATVSVGNVDASVQIGTSGIFTFHELELLGDFTNNGNVSFTNLSPTSIADGRYRDKYPTAADTDNDDIPVAEFGVLELLLTNGSADQTLTFNGPSDFYRIEVNKGTSQTFIAELNASATSNFRLLGRIAMSQSDDSGNTPNIDNHRALGLEAGILKLGTNIVIDQIAKDDNASTQGGNRNYMIDLDAQLWLSENSSVSKANDWGIHPFGTLKVSDDATLTFSGTGNRAILVDNQGVFEMTGGTVNISQFRNKTGADGAPRGSFIMTGGTLNVGNGAVDGSHGVFSVPWEDQNFVLSASDEANPPTVNIILDGDRGKDDAAVQIGAGEGNYDVGVSNFNIIHTSNADYKMISSVPLYNFSYDNSGTGELIIDDIEDSNGDAAGAGGVLPDDNSGTTPSPAQVALPLTVTNDFTITDGRFDANDFDLTVGNLFTISSGAEYDAGANTTLFDGSSPVQRMRLNGADPLLGGFNNLSFTGSGTTKEFGGDLASFNVLGDLSIGSGVTLNDDGKTIIVNGNIDNSGTHETDFASPGRIELSGGASQHVIGGDGNGRFEILTLDNVLGATLSANQQVDSVLNLVTGVLDINTNQLTINSTAASPILDDAGGTANFGTTRMVQTSGNASDGGIRRYFDSTADPGTVMYPFGVSGKYTPAQADLVNVSDDGFVQINPVNSNLNTTDNSGGAMLGYYWRVRNDGFTALPDVTTLQFIADASDLAAPINLAEGQTATQSSTYNGRAASAAVDGNTSGNGEANVTHTLNDNEAYWTVDLGAVENITAINIWNRTDCCGNRLVNYHVFVSDNAFTGTTVAESQAQIGVIEFFESAEAGSPTTISTGAITGRYVRVQLAGTNFLSLAEVEVFGGSLASATLVPGGVEDGVDSDDAPATDTDFNRFYETNGFSSPTITFDGELSDGTVQPFQLRTANYTAGETDRFTGSPDIFYTFRTGDGFPIKWNDGNNWTYGLDALYEPHDTRQTAAGDYPQAGDIAVVGWVPHGDPGGNDGEPHGVAIDGINVDVAEIRFNQMLDPIGDPTARIYTRNFQFRPTVVLNGSGQITNGVVSGEGMFWNRNSDPDFTSADLGGFVSQDSSYVLYENNNSGNVFVNVPAVLPNLLIGADGWGANDRDFQLLTSITVNQSLEILGDANLVLSSGVAGDITVNQDLRIFRSNVSGNDSGGFGRIDYPNDASRTIEVFGDLKLENQEALVQVLNPDNTTQNVSELIVHGDITQDVTSNGGLQLFTATDEDYVSLTLTGAGNHSFTITSGADAALYDLTVNKGTDQTSSFTFNDNFTLNGLNNSATKALQLQNGTLVINDAATDIELNTGGGDFTIPETAGLTLNAGTARISAAGTGTGNGLRLDGKITLGGGDLILDGGASADNYIEYGTGGGAEVEITSGNLVVGSQFRRNALSGDGVINYTQTGGTAIFGANLAPEDSRGVFEIINTGPAGTSSFNLSGASTVFALVQAQDAPENGTFIIGDDVDASVSTDATIDFGFNGTVAAGTYSNDLNETYQITSSVALPNIRIDSDNTNAPVLEMIIQPLTVSNSLEILNGGSLVANGFDLTVNDVFTNDGTYTPGSNTTTFNGNTQTIAGTTASVFNNLTISPTTSLTLANTISVNGDMVVTSGTFDDDGNRVTLLGDLSVTTTLVSDGSGTGGVLMDGTSNQSLWLPDGAATIDKLLINNPNGIDQQENGGAATVLTINDELALDNGLFNLGDNRVIFDSDATATSSTGFDETKMISVNGVKLSDGVERQFLAGVDAAPFEIPVGTPDKYTPVTLDVDGSDDGGSILVKPINSIHPSATGTDALNYYWLVTTNPSSVANFSGSVSFEYLESDANNAGQNESTWEDNAARLLSPNWFKPSVNQVDITNNIITWSQTELTAGGAPTTFDGEYTIGNDIPDLLAQYRSNASGIWNDVDNWDIDRDGDGVFDEAVDDAPINASIPIPGTIVVIDTGDEIIMNDSDGDNDQNIFSVEILGTLDVNDTDGHNFGEISGTGTLKISNSTLPGGNYDNFFLTTGGSLDLAGPSGYTISPSFASGVRGLTVSGGGTKVLPAIAINVGVDGINVLENATLSNPNNNTMQTSGAATINTSGSLELGSSAASLSAVDLNLIAGTFNSSGAAIDLSGDLNLNGGVFNASSASHNIGGDFSYNTASTFNESTSTFIFDGASDQNVTVNAASTIDFQNLDVDKSGGDLILGTNASVHINNGGQLGLLNGSVINTQASGSQLRLVGTATYSGSSDGYIDGPLFKDLDDAASNFEFRIGKGAIYKPITINPLNGSYAGDITWEIEYYPQDASTFSSGENSIDNLTSIETNADTDEQVVTISSAEFWRIDDGGGNGDLDEITLSISSINAGVTQDDINDQLLQVMVWDEANTEWDHLGGTSAGTPSSASIVSGVDLSFTEKIVTIGAESADVLPVELIDFDGEIFDNITRLSWSTATELNNDYFEIQHSVDGIDFQVIGQVDGYGNSDQVRSYSFSHSAPAFGVNYYRLRQVDFDGKTEVHETLRLYNDFVRKGIDVIIYPNPGMASKLRLKLSSGDNNTPIQVRIVDLSGQVYYQKAFGGSLAVDEHLGLGSQMTPGIYFIEVTQGENIRREKVIVR